LGAADLGAADVGAADVGAADVGAADVGAADLGAADVGAADVGAADVGDEALRLGLVLLSAAIGPATYRRRRHKAKATRQSPLAMSVSIRHLIRMKIDLDARGRACPIPIVELMKAMRGCSPGDQVELKANDRAFPVDVAAWCKKTGHSLLSLEVRGAEYVAVVRKP